MLYAMGMGVISITEITTMLMLDKMYLFYVQILYVVCDQYRLLILALL
jgi:hypothetical protein